MKSQTAVSTICRACGQRSQTFRSNAIRPSTIQPTNTSSLSQLTLALRSLSTTSHPQAETTDTIAVSSPQPPPEPKIETEIPPKLFTATITYIHNLTAHATYTKQHWDPKFQRYYTKAEHVLVHDPFSADLDVPSTTPSTTTTTPKPHPHAPRPSLLRVSDVVHISPLTPSELSQRADRHTHFSSLLLQRKLKSAGKHRNQIIRAHNISLGRKTRTTRNVRFAVREVLTPFGEGMEERMRRVREMGKLGGVDGQRTGGLEWWQRREGRGALKK